MSLNKLVLPFVPSEWQSIKGKFQKIITVSKEHHFYVILKVCVDKLNNVKVMTIHTLGNLRRIKWWQPCWRSPELPGADHIKIWDQLLFTYKVVILMTL